MHNTHTQKINYLVLLPRRLITLYYCPRKEKSTQIITYSTLSHSYETKACTMHHRRPYLLIPRCPFPALGMPYAM
jgi:hypothetical protein